MRRLRGLARALTEAYKAMGLRNCRKANLPGRRARRKLSGVKRESTCSSHQRCVYHGLPPPHTLSCAGFALGSTRTLPPMGCLMCQVESSTVLSSLPKPAGDTAARSYSCILWASVRYGACSYGTRVPVRSCALSEESTRRQGCPVLYRRPQASPFPERPSTAPSSP
jgi:hypothetical protein